MIRIKKMIRLVSTIIFAVSSSVVQANSVENLEVLKALLPKVCHFSGEFSQSKQIKTLPIPLISNGEFFYSCDLGLIWKTKTPIYESLVFTNKKLHFLVPEKLSIENLDGVQHDFLANLLLGLMAGNTDFIANEFDLSFAADNQNLLTLEPKNKMVRQAIQSVVLKKSGDKNELEITITDKNQQITKIVSSETQQFVSAADFSKSCESFAAKSCKLLSNPVRISTSGKN